MRGKYVHVTADGQRIPVVKLTDKHLSNILNYLKLKATTGIKVRVGGGNDPDSFWYEEYYVYGRKALKMLRYDVYEKELKRRNNEGK